MRSLMADRRRRAQRGVEGQIAVEREVRSALCEHTGLLGNILALLERFDNDDAPGCDQLLSSLPDHFDHQTLNTCLSAALRWLNNSDE